MRNRTRMHRSIQIWVLSLVITGCCLAVALGVGAAAGGADDAAGVDVQLASTKEIKNLNRTDGKVRLVNFWATWCGPCKEEFPQLVSLFHRFQPKGLEFVTISADDKENRDQVVKFLVEHEASGKNLLFSGRDTAGMLESFDRKWKEILPYTVLFDSQGKIVYRREGQIDPSDLRKAIEKLLGPAG